MLFIALNIWIKNGKLLLQVSEKNVSWNEARKLLKLVHSLKFVYFKPKACAQARM